MAIENQSLHWRLYELAAPLREALESFAPPQVQEQFATLSWGDLLILKPDYFWNRQRARIHNFLGVLIAFLPAALQFPVKAHALRARQLARLCDVELAYIHGLPRYLMLGFAVPRTVNDEPVPVPLDCWDGDVDWETESLRAGSLGFEGLRIVDFKQVPDSIVSEWEQVPKAAEPQAAAAPAAAGRAKQGKPGPKSAQAPICRAVDELFPNPEFRKAPQKTQLEMVLRLLKGTDLALDALLEKASPKTLQGHIARRIKELESSSKA